MKLDKSGVTFGNRFAEANVAAASKLHADLDTRREPLELRIASPNGVWLARAEPRTAESQLASLALIADIGQSVEVSQLGRTRFCVGGLPTVHWDGVSGSPDRLGSTADQAIGNAFRSCIKPANGGVLQLCKFEEGMVPRSRCIEVGWDAETNSWKIGRAYTLAGSYYDGTVTALAADEVARLLGGSIADGVLTRHASPNMHRASV